MEIKQQKNCDKFLSLIAFHLKCQHMYRLCTYFMPWFFFLLFSVDLFPSLSCLSSSSPPSSCYTSEVNTPEARPTAKVSSHSNFPWHPLPVDLSRVFTWQNAEGFLILIEESSFSNNMEGNYGLYYWFKIFFNQFLGQNCGRKFN